MNFDQSKLNSPSMNNLFNESSEKKNIEENYK